MQTATKYSKVQARVIPIKPAYLSRVDAMKYVGMGRYSFDKAALRFQLKVYSYGTKKILYKVDDLEKMMNSFLLINKKGVNEHSPIINH